MVETGKYYSIKGIDEYCLPKIKRRLCDLGFIKGEKIKLLRKSLLKRAFLIEIRGAVLTLKREIAAYVLVEC